MNGPRIGFSANAKTEEFTLRQAEDETRILERGNFLRPETELRAQAYTDVVKKILLFLSLSFLVGICVFGQETPSAGNASKTAVQPRPGELTREVRCAANAKQSYALYLPKNYAASRKWPVVYAFDPAARGSVPLELMKDAAEKYGYILAGSNNSRNGPRKLEGEAAQAVLQDVQARLAIDDRRSYFAGFSGGARVAALIAQVCQCAAGVLLNGAGFPQDTPPSREATFPVFAAVGTYDFNYAEVVKLDEKLQGLGSPHFLRTFEGPHQWAPAPVMDEALAWFRLLAMKDGREPPDAAFVAAEASQAAERARALEQSGDLYAAWKEYTQAARTFSGIMDNAALRARAEALEKEKAIREGAKREEHEFAEQGELTADILAGLAALGQNAVNRSEVRLQVEQQILGLHGQAEHEKHAEKLRVLKRALADVFAQAMETGERRLEAKDAARAQDYFQLASEAQPDSLWALTDLAVAKAEDGNRKGALETLRHLREKTKDFVRFSEWLKEEPAFAGWRNTADFRALLVDPAPQR
jgi:dienelactone hydrolase